MDGTKVPRCQGTTFWEYMNGTKVPKYQGTVFLEALQTTLRVCIK